MTEQTTWPALMRPATAAAYVDLSERQINRLREKKAFPPPVVVGDSPRYRKTDLDAWAAKLQPASA